MSNAVALMGFDPKEMAVALKKASQQAAPMAAYLSMSKRGIWTYGMDGVEVEPGVDEFLVHPGGFTHGWVCWADTTLPKVKGAKLGEIMVGVNTPMPDEPVEVPVNGKGWQVQMGMSLVAVADDAKLVYATPSVGGKRAVSNIADQISEKLAAEDPKCVPVVTLDCAPYTHPQHGEVTNPVMTVVRWVGVPKAGQSAAEVASAGKPAAKKIAAKPTAKKAR